MKLIKITTMAMATLLVMLATSLPALAQRYSEREIFQLGRRNGYDYGMRDGRSDRQEGRRYDPKRNRAYKDGKWGYREEYRHDGNYRDGFRDGFLAGYDAAYNGRGGRGNRRDDDWDRRDRRDDDWDRRDRRDRDDDWNRGRGNGNGGGRRNNRPWWDILTPRP